MYHNGPHNPAPRPDAVLVPVMTQATNSSFLHNKTRFSLKVMTFHSKYHPLISKLFFSAAGLCNLLDFNVGEDGEKTERVVPDWILGNSQKATEKSQGPCVHRENTKSQRVKTLSRSLLIILHPVSLLLSFLLPTGPQFLSQHQQSPLGHPLLVALQTALVHPSLLVFCTQVCTRHIILCLSIDLPPCFVPRIPLPIHHPHNLLSAVPFIYFLSSLPLCVTHPEPLLHPAPTPWSLLSVHMLHPPFPRCF